ncbi:alginate lyase family protein [Christiangramia crocea]|uniref:Heparinase II/III family protein n=1 Tax=Christiangramia crocea TaxID=2904124 RepID=A0A9X1UY61_9FLAO|nr:alginate lyase family protein [Gramella crocea]MCG9972146.1 heparinase II/III family protein [Gramella crocea]
MIKDRRELIKLLAGGGLGLLCINPILAKHLGIDSPSAISNPEIKKQFPFIKYLKKYNIGELIPKDQGGKLVHMELLKTEVDEEIVAKINKGLIEEEYGVNIGWDVYEDTQVEKSVWLNRFYFLPSFARMFYLTGDSSYLKTMMKYISKWIKDNPLTPDAQTKNYNWRDMQAAWRVIHWTWCLYLTENKINKQEKDLIENSLKDHGQVLLTWFGKQKLNEFNHQAHGGLAMLYLGVFFPHFKQAGELKETGITILTHHLNKAFYKDGGNVEQMFGYYPFETHIFRDMYLFSMNNEFNAPENLKPKLKQMGAFIKTVAQPDNTMPPINDSYEMPVGSSIAVLEDILSSPLKGSATAFLPETQLAVLRSEKPNEKWYVTANPAKTIGAHAHAGRLGFTLWYNGTPIVIDSGVCNYDDPKLVTWYRTSEAHNTVLIDGKTDIETSTDVLWTSKRTTGNHIRDLEETELFKACYMTSPRFEEVNSRVQWNRNVALVDDKYFILHDCFESEDEHDFELLLHFPEVHINENEKTLSGQGKDESFKIIVPNRDLYEKVEVRSGLISKKAENVVAPMASYKFKGDGVVHSILVIAPNYIDLQMEYSSKKTGAGVKFTDAGKDIFLLVKNPGTKDVAAFGKRSEKEFNVLR